MWLKYSHTEPRRSVHSVVLFHNTKKRSLQYATTVLPCSGQGITFKSQDITCDFNIPFSAKFPNVKTVTKEVQTRARIPTLLRRQVHVVNAHKHSNTYTQTCILHTSHWCTLCVLHCRYFICSPTDRRIDVYCANVSDSEQSNTISETGGEQKCMRRNV